MTEKKWFLNGGRGSGRTFRLLCEIYENKIANLQQEFRKQTEEAKFEAFSVMCEKVADLEKKNAELETEIETKDILIKELQEQKLYWKNSSFDWRHKFFKLDKIKRLVKKDKQLTKAKELLKQWVQYGHVNELLEQATLSFINSEVEK